ncbi:MAG: phosphohydrolase, partial [Clostridia bacterium]|nr:phosphohydrolase [Clostridia bacterium]
DLIEAISVGHDLGHTPFGHRGEHLLSDLYHKHTGRYFNHNVQSVRLLRTVAKTNLCLQTYNGILCHCGEKAFTQYEPSPCRDFKALDRMMNECYKNPRAIDKLKPSTLEGCVVRISDIVAYVGKDRQDASKLGYISESSFKESELLGKKNYEMIQRITRNIIKNSIEKNYIAMDQDVFNALVALKDENSKHIYTSEFLDKKIAFAEEMMHKMYNQLLDDVLNQNQNSPIYRHHINKYFMPYDYSWELENRPDDIVVDYIASMTDDYFVELFKFMFPNDPLNKQVIYQNYFDGYKKDKE